MPNMDNTLCNKNKKKLLPHSNPNSQQDETTRTSKSVVRFFSNMSKSIFHIHFRKHSDKESLYWLNEKYSSYYNYGHTDARTVTKYSKVSHFKVPSNNTRFLPSRYNHFAPRRHF